MGAPPHWKHHGPGHPESYHPPDSSTKEEDPLHGTFRQSRCNQLSRFQIDLNKKLVALNAEAAPSCSTLSSGSQRLALGIQLSQKRNRCRFHFPSSVAGPPRSEVAPRNCTYNHALDAPWRTGFLPRTRPSSDQLRNRRIRASSILASI